MTVFHRLNRRELYKECIRLSGEAGKNTNETVVVAGRIKKIELHYLIYSKLYASKESIC